MSTPTYNRTRAERLRYSRHALDTMSRRDVTHEDVEAALMHPDVVEDNEHKGRTGWRFHKGPLCVVVSRDGGFIITVLLRAVETWTDQQAAQAIHGRDGQPSTFKPYAASAQTKEHAA